MKRTTIGILAAALALTLSAPALSAEETPKGLWLKVKCALCHGEDGAADTPTGKKTGAPDLRTPDIQQLNDEELTKRVENGHAKMPAFKVQLTKDQIKMLVFYIRDIGKQAAKN